MAIKSEKTILLKAVLHIMPIIRALLAKMINAYQFFIRRNVHRRGYKVQEPTTDSASFEDETWRVSVSVFRIEKQRWFSGFKICVRRRTSRTCFEQWRSTGNFNRSATRNQ